LGLERHHPIGIGKCRWPEKNRIGNREHRYIRGDRQRDDGDRRQSERSGLEGPAHEVSGVLRERFAAAAQT
jgi:hypothetical protein